LKLCAFSFLVLSALALWGEPAHAACNSPSGVAGDLTYATNLNVMVYCDGTDWIKMGPDIATLGTICVPGTPSSVSFITDSDPNTKLDGAGDVEIESGYAYVTSFGQDALSIIDISDPANPVGSAPLPMPIRIFS
jgi:hypothetical protein